ncbi:MAG: triose-phosphate isomerase [Acidobacteriia bacterium]|nr:triose-phosphate isomerase [Terriglobia bacterium]
MRQPVIVGNWKMHKTIRESIHFVEQLKPLIQSASCDIIVSPPFTSLSAASKATLDTQIKIGAQDLYWENSGAFTGEISPQMALEAGCRYVILGHSERRIIFGETSQSVSKKAAAAIAAGLIPIICLGEKEKERQSGKTHDVIGMQFRQSLASLTPEIVSHIILAYEPVWAIGTGMTATPQIAQEVHSYLRQLTIEMFNRSASDNVRLLYGGSVKPENISSLMVEKDIDGVLVGGASLKVESFAKIINFEIR